jgi:hypothetical protein
MTPMFEKALDAALDQLVECRDVSDGDVEKALRAAFLAVRVPDDQIVSAGQSLIGAYDMDKAWGSAELRRYQAANAYTAMIGAVLSDQ